VVTDRGVDILNVPELKNTFPSQIYWSQKALEELSLETNAKTLTQYSYFRLQAWVSKLLNMVLYGKIEKEAAFLKIWSIFKDSIKDDISPYGIQANKQRPDWLTHIKQKLESSNGASLTTGSNEPGGSTGVHVTITPGLHLFQEWPFASTRRIDAVQWSLVNNQLVEPVVIHTIITCLSDKATASTSLAEEVERIYGNPKFSSQQVDFSVNPPQLKKSGSLYAEMQHRMAIVNARSGKVVFCHGRSKDKKREMLQIDVDFDAEVWGSLFELMKEMVAMWQSADKFPVLSNLGKWVVKTIADDEESLPKDIPGHACRYVFTFILG
jgi:hypothetical protein